MKKCLVVILIVFCSLRLTAQNYHQYSDQENNQNQNRNNQNNQGQGFKVYQKKEGPDGYMQLIKICPQYLLEGNVPIYYERRLGGNVSIEASLGVTFNNYTWDVFEQGELYNSGSIPVNTRYYQPSFSAGGGIRYYPSGTFDGFYIAPEIRYRNYQSKGLASNATNPGNPTTNPSNYLQESLVFTDFKFVFGYVTYIEDVMPIEFFWGLGIRERNETRVYNATTTGSGSMGLETFVKSGPLLSCGIKIGIGLR